MDVKDQSTEDKRTRSFQEALMPFLQPVIILAIVSGLIYIFELRADINKLDLQIKSINQVIYDETKYFKEKFIDLIVEKAFNRDAEKTPTR